MVRNADLLSLQKQTKDDQQPGLLLPARWLPDTLPEFEIEGGGSRCGFVDNLSLKSIKCHGCTRRIQTKGERLDGILFTNADSRYAGKIDDPQGGDTTMLMQQVREVTTVNQELEDESIWTLATLEQMGFLLRSQFAKENHGEAGSSKQCNDQRTDQTAFFGAH